MTMSKPETDRDKLRELAYLFGSANEYVRANVDDMDESTVAQLLEMYTLMMAGVRQSKIGQKGKLMSFGSGYGGGGRGEVN